MAHDFCPQAIRLEDGTECTLYETWTDEYLRGLLALEICNYRCPGSKYHSRWRLRLFGILVGPVGGREYDPAHLSPLPPDPPCPPTLRPDSDMCPLAAFWVLTFLRGIMRIEVCIYSCDDDLFFYARWRTSFFGFPLPWRERGTFPNPI